MVEDEQSVVSRPADDVYCWLEKDSSLMLKAGTRLGDPVELTAEDARSIAAVLLALADRLEPLAEKRAEPRDCQESAP